LPTVVAGATGGRTVEFVGVGDTYGCGTAHPCNARVAANADKQSAGNAACFAGLAAPAETALDLKTCVRFIAIPPRRMPKPEARCQALNHA
jgi:hypothetical protein